MNSQILGETILYPGELLGSICNEIPETASSVLSGHVKVEPLSDLDACDDSNYEPGEPCCGADLRVHQDGYVAEYAAANEWEQHHSVARFDTRGLSSVVTDQLQARGIRLARVTVREIDTEIQLIVERDAVKSGTAISRLGRYDVITLQKTDGRLLISANCTLARETYRQLLGSFFGNSTQLFQCLYRLTSKPLVERGAQALASHGIGAVKNAVLRQLRFEVVGTMESIDWKGSDLGRQLDTHLGQLLRRHREIRAFRLDLLTKTLSRRVTVDVRVPHLLRYSHPAAKAVVLEFLEATGFLQREPIAGGNP